MNCEEVRRHWNLYHDSEGDAALHLHVNEHLALCSACADWFAKQSRFEDVFARHLSLKHSDSQLWHSALAGAGVITPSSRTRFARPILLVVGLAAVLVLAVTVEWLRLIHSAAEQPSLSAQAASRHVQLAGSEEAVPFHSESDLDVELYLRRQVGFPVRCPPRKDARFRSPGGWDLPAWWRASGLSRRKGRGAASFDLHSFARQLGRLSSSAGRAAQRAGASLPGKELRNGAVRC